MASNGLPGGWSYEPADWSVGITTDGFVHEDCPNDYDKGVRHDYTADEVHIECLDCGAKIEVEAPEPELPEDLEDWG